MTKKAVVLFNLGGPDGLESVRPFLSNLFNDPAILSVPKILRSLLAWFIAWRRTPTAQEIYQHLGGKSPLLEQTNMQADALEKILREKGDEWRVFVAMRYWHPLTPEVVASVKAFAPDEIILVPLYPQYSSATSGSSLKLWEEESEKQNLTCPVRALCCYPEEAGFISSLAQRVGTTLSQIVHYPKVRVLLSAHGLPERMIRAGDPYQDHVEKTCRALISKVQSARPEIKNTEWVICYQSRVGPLRWIGPATDDEIKKAGHENIPVVVVPVSFVSEHSETLVELDIEYRKLAQEHGVPAYRRVMTVQCDAPFIKGLAQQIHRTLDLGCVMRSHQDERICTSQHMFCPHVHAVKTPCYGGEERADCGI